MGFFLSVIGVVGAAFTSMFLAWALLGLAHKRVSK